MQRTKKAFTMVEMAIVLVIIGLILGAVMKGQELINNAKQKRYYSLEREIVASVLTYYDKFNAYPGDDPQAQKHLNDTNTKNGDGDGHIEGGFIYNCSDNTKETCALWEHLRLANILSGNGVANPRNPYGGSVAINYYAISGKYANWIAFSNIPIATARSIDEKYDDGVYNTGSIRASKDYSSTTTEPFVTQYFEF